MTARVVYRGIKMAAEWPERIIASQAQPHYTHAGVRYPRVRYGDENPHWGAAPCRDCGVVKGEFHVTLECQYEACPVCGASQLGTCSHAFAEAGEGHGEPEPPETSRLGDIIPAVVLGGIILLCVVATVLATFRFI